MTTSAYLAGAVPEAEILVGYARLGGGVVAVRSSATAEDLPTDSVADRYDVPPAPRLRRRNPIVWSQHASSGLTRAVCFSTRSGRLAR